MSELLTQKEAADFLRVSAKHFRAKFINKGLVSYIDLGDRSKKFEKSELVKLINESRNKCQSISETKRTGSSSRITAKQLGDLLAPAQSAKLSNSNAS